MTNEIVSGSELTQVIAESCEKLEQSVGSTMGPKGRNVILSNDRDQPVTTKDGVTVAEFFNLEDPVENTIATILKQASQQTNERAGDGTTTSTVLANAIIQKAVRYLLKSETSPVHVTRGIERASELVVEYIEEQKIPIVDADEIENIATISANGDKSIGKMIARAINRVGIDGSVLVGESSTSNTHLEFEEGYRLSSGYASRQFVNNEAKQIVDYNDPLIFVTDYTINNITSHVKPIIAPVATEDRPVIVVAPKIEGQGLASFVHNAIQTKGNTKGMGLKCAAVNAPYFGTMQREVLKDLAAKVGANFYSEKQGDTLKNITIDDFGSCDQIQISMNQTSIVSGKGLKEEQEKRINEIEDMVDRLVENGETEKAERHKERSIRMSSGVAIIKVGAMTSTEFTSKRHRVEDALEAAESAIDDGVLPGGGSVLLRATERLEKLKNGPDADLGEDERIGVDILQKALESPVRRMAQNASISPDIAVQKIIEEERDDYAIDFTTGELVKMTEEGIIDPKKVVEVALESAVSAANSLLISNTMQVNTEFNKNGELEAD